MRVLDYNQATPIQKTKADFGLLLAHMPLGVYFALAEKRATLIMFNRPRTIEPSPFDRRS